MATPMFEQGLTLDDVLELSADNYIQGTDHECISVFNTSHDLAQVAYTYVDRLIAPERNICHNS